ncbi:MAG TPA: hypothetical protein VIY52_16325 [Streptosporangiaceae bacterium]
MRRAAALVSTVFIGVGLAACSDAPAHPHTSVPRTARTSLLSLTCPESAGQQGGDQETVVAGVEGLVLPGSDDPGGLYPIRAADGKRYFVYKDFLAVSAADAPFATVSVIRPAGAALVYGSSSRIGELFSASSGQGLVAVSRRMVRLPVCGPRFTGFVGGVILAGPACVTFEVSSPSARPRTVSVPIGVSAC